VPAITLSVVFAIKPEVIGVPDLVHFLYNGAPKEKLLSGLKSFSRYFDLSAVVDRLHNTSSPGIIEFLGNPQPLNIIFTSREFQLHGELFGGEFKFVGPSILAGRDDSCGFPFDQLRAGPLVYISLGTTFHHAPEFYRACFEAFSNTAWQIVLSTGGSPAAPLGTPPRNLIVREYVPQLKILERASVFITHGGMNSANEGLYSEVPLIVVPQRGDQYLVAARIAELGAGLSLWPHEVTPENLRTMTEKVISNPDFRAQARLQGQALRNAGGHRRAADEILRHLENWPGRPKAFCA